MPIEKTERNAAIVAAKEAGETVPDIAAKFEISESRVSQIISRAGEKETAPTPRQQETKKQRRRRSDTSENRTMKLSVDERAKDPNYEYRWINDTAEGRIHQKTRFDDWDVVTSDQMKGYADPSRDMGEGTAVKRNVGSTKNGEPLYAYLCRKPREFYEEDERAKQREIDEMEASLKRQAPQDPQGIEQGKAYVPGGTNTIQHGEQ